MIWKDYQMTQAGIHGLEHSSFMSLTSISLNQSDTIYTGRPSFTKLAHDIKIYYNEDAQSWVINNEGENVAFAVSNAQSPSHIPSGLVFISFYIDR